MILAKTFEGNHLSVKVDEKKGIILDCMFFTTTCEPLNKEAPKYKSMPTFLLCNPNAMFYQHMVNHPHAFYLRFFLNRGINVLIWNYRGYGMSNGAPDPFNIRADADSMFDFMRD